MRTACVFSVLFALSAHTAAWPWPLPEDLYAGKAVMGIERLLYGRQDNTASNSPSTSSQQQASRTTTASKTGTVSQNASGTRSGASSGATITNAPTATFANGNDTSSSTDYDQRLPAGGVSMITPAAIAGPQYYKVGDWLTFAWNYTSLSASPSAIDVVASCAANSATYTLASNLSIADQQTVLWDTSAQATGQAPLLTNQYTLIIYDAGGSVSATPKAGYLAVQRGVTFGMYVKQDYTPWSDFNCPTCSGALSLHGRQTLSFMLGMATLTVLSFSWFARGFGVF